MRVIKNIYLRVRKRKESTQKSHIKYTKLKGK